MTQRELSQLKHLEREIAELRGRLARVGDKAFSSCAKKKGKKTDDLEAILREREHQCAKERERLEAYISEIPDSFTRQIFTYRFVDGLSWTRVALAAGGGMTSDCARKICSRYIEKKSR